MSWKEEATFVKIKLPRSFTYFSSLDKEKDPYTKMYSWAAKKAFKNSLYNILYDKNVHILETLSKEYGMSVSDFWLTKEDDDKMKDIVLSWIMKFHKKGKKRAMEALRWHNFDRGPACFGDTETPTWAQQGYIYVRKPNE